jgi:hypothetical protein
MRKEDVGKTQEQIIEEIRTKLDAIPDFSELEHKIAVLETDVEILKAGGQ